MPGSITSRTTRSGASRLTRRRAPRARSSDAGRCGRPAPDNGGSAQQCRVLSSTTRTRATRASYRIGSPGSVTADRHYNRWRCRFSRWPPPPCSSAFLHGLGGDHLMAIAALVGRRPDRSPPVARHAHGGGVRVRTRRRARRSARPSRSSFGIVVPAAVSSGAERLGGADPDRPRRHRPLGDRLGARLRAHPSGKRRAIALAPARRRASRPPARRARALAPADGDGRPLRREQPARADAAAAVRPRRAGARAAGAPPAHRALRSRDPAVDVALRRAARARALAPRGRRRSAGPPPDSSRSHRLRSGVLDVAGSESSFRTLGRTRPRSSPPTPDSVSRAGAAASRRRASASTEPFTIITAGAVNTSARAPATSAADRPSAPQRHHVDADDASAQLVGHRELQQREAHREHGHREHAARRTAARGSTAATVRPRTRR